MAYRAKQWDFRGGDMDPPDPREFVFVEGFGYRYTGDGRSVLIGATAVTKPDKYLSDAAFVDFGGIVQEYHDAINGLSHNPYFRGKILEECDFRPYDGRYAYKFVSEEDYESFILNGSFLLSSLSRFRDLEVEDHAAGDRFEGSAKCSYRVADRELITYTISAFDQHIFSLSRDLKNAELMKDKFGSIVLRFDLTPFAWGLSRALKAGSPEVRLVRYADLKLFRGSLPVSAVEGLPSMRPRFAKALRDRGRLPSLFSKPRAFEDEREVRIAIPSERDVLDKTIIRDLRLLKYVERVEI